MKLIILFLTILSTSIAFGQGKTLDSIADLSIIQSTQSFDHSSIRTGVTFGTQHIIFDCMIIGKNGETLATLQPFPHTLPMVSPAFKIQAL